MKATRSLIAVFTSFAVVVLVSLAGSLACGAAGGAVSYKVGGDAFEGYLVMPSPEAPLVLLVHDWDGLTDYEVRRAERCR